MIIAIDGPAASGKGTIGRRLAEKLQLAFLDTGLLYRAAAKRILDQGVNPSNVAAVIGAVGYLTIEDTSADDLRSPAVSSTASLIAGIPEVRDMLARLQREFAVNPPPGKFGSVLDGRDIGTTICPDADVKIFVTASLDTRAARRLKELLVQGVQTSYQVVYRDVKRRDEQDVSRTTSPLRIADDAVVIDTTDLSADQAFEAALALVPPRSTSIGGNARPGG
jgi:cytidylate kinase